MLLGALTASPTQCFACCRLQTAFFFVTRDSAERLSIRRLCSLSSLLTPPARILVTWIPLQPADKNL